MVFSVSLAAIVNVAISVSMTGGTPSAGVKILFNGVQAATFTTDINGNLAAVTVAWASIPSGSTAGAAFVSVTMTVMASPANGVIISFKGDNAASSLKVDVVYS